MRIWLRCALFLLYSAVCFAETPEYDLQITISPETKQMKVHGKVKIPARSELRDSIDFALSELMQDVKVEILSPIPEKTPAVTNTLRPSSRPGWGHKTWSITPKEKIPANSPVVLRFQYRYEGQPAFVLSGSDRCFFASGINSAWYPEIEEFPRTDDGIRLRGLRGHGKIGFQLPAGWNVYAPGVRANTKNVVEFKIDQPVFFSFAAANYSVDQISDPLDVSLYQLKPRGARMATYLTKSAQVLQVLSNEFGAYPHPHFAVVEVPPDEADAAGFAGASLDGFMLATTDFLDQDFNTAYYGHEIGHQWWGQLIRPEGPEARWLLTEAMSQYGSLRAVEVLEGPVRAEAYRRKGYPGYIQDQSGFGYLLISAAGMDVPLIKLPTDGSLSRWLADSKGFFAFDMLSREVGREKFSAALKSITTKYAGRRIHWNEFKNEVGNFSDQDPGWFFHQWFEQTGLPEWDLVWNQKDGKLSMKLHQRTPHFKFRVKATIQGKDQELSRDLTIDQESENFIFDIPFPVTDVKMNAHFELLAWTQEYKREATALVPYTRASLTHNDGNTAKARELFVEGLRNLPSPDPYGVTFLMHYGLGVLLFYEDELEESRKHLELALKAPVKRPERLPWAYLRLAEIADKQNNSALVCSSLKSVITSDRNAPDKTGAAEHTQELNKKHNCHSKDAGS